MRGDEVGIIEDKGRIGAHVDRPLGDGGFGIARRRTANVMIGRAPQ
jgi:hypothetical protein